MGKKNTVRNIERDKEKDQALLFLGWTIIHFWGKDILNNVEECITVVEETVFDEKMTEDLFIE